MGIFSRMASRPAAMNSDELYRMIISTFGGGPTSSGVSVNSSTAMRLNTVHTCVKVLYETVMQLPCNIMEQVGDKKSKATDFYLYELLHDQPNSWMTAPEFWGMSEAHIALRGNFYAYKSGLPGRPIKELIPIPPDFVQKVTQNADYSLDYEIHFPDGEVKHLNNQQVMHLRGLTLNGYTGVNPIEYCRETIGLGLAGEKFLSRYFSKGMHPGVVFKHPLPLNAPAHANLKANLKAKYEGLGQSHEMMLVDEGMTVEFPPIKLVDAQFMELMKMTKEDICGLYRVPLMLVQSGDKAPTYASAEQFMLSFVVHSLMPKLVNREKVIRRDLMTPAERKRYFAKFEVKALMRGSMAERSAFYKDMVNAEIFNPNECRDWEDLNPYQGGEIYKTRTSTTKQPDQAVTR